MPKSRNAQITNIGCSASTLKYKFHKSCHNFVNLRIFYKTSPFEPHLTWEDMPPRKNIAFLRFGWYFQILGGRFPLVNIPKLKFIEHYDIHNNY